MIVTSQCCGAIISTFSHMKILNIHKRVIHQTKESILEIWATLATEADRLWPEENWPPMRFKEGLQVGAHGGHGSIRYRVVRFDPEGMVEFEFTKPAGFHGRHRLEIFSLDTYQTEIKHTIEMETSGLSILYWNLVIRWLHDALLEDAFDKLENNFSAVPKRTNWSAWVRFWRKMLGSRIWRHFLK